ncbi:tumor necrosis factor receptor superfamily member 6 isoform X2 [Hyla sarda]|uniref:tumor necrosis factor receptor superfamily member 6 isoform X2 n=1 Tax=Hyla sarda TaxID=327740 RepID=UPI0024C40F3B|nr:tumor necrosis factor receptor superfamily member 6 isoform X2 [Hyla sarda]
MKFGCGAALLILIQCSVVFPYSSYMLHKLRKREIECPGGEYFSGTYCCEFCKPGTYAKNDCTENHGKPVCQTCDGEHYMDADNGNGMCHKCSHCDNQLGQEELRACTVRTNTVCRCKEKHFCAENQSESDGCMKCEHCKECQYGDAEPCSATKDTVCKQPRNHYYLIFLSVALIPFGILLYALKRRENNTNNSRRPEELPFVFPKELEDIDLSRHLADFSQKMDHKTVVDVVRNMELKEATVEEIRLDHAHSHNDQKIYLLKAWYESYGRKGAFQQLIRTLRNIDRRVTAEELINITRSHGDQSED